MKKTGVLLFIISSLLLASCKPELKMVIEIFRHGARAPLGYDPWNVWNQSGELTANGLRQHFNLGLEVKKRYSHLLPSQYDPRLIKVQSTPLNRTLQSVYSQLYAIFSATNQQNYPKLEDGFNLSLASPPLSNISFNHSKLSLSALPQNHNPFPVHTTELRDNHLLLPYLREVCPYVDVLIKKQHKALFSNQYAEFLSMALPWVKKAVENKWIASNDSTSREALLQASVLYDTLIADYTEGLPIPFQPGSEEWLAYEYLYLGINQILYFSNPLHLQIANANFFNYLLDTFDRKTSNRTDLRFVFLSAHDTNLLAILSILNQTHFACFSERYKNKNLNASTCSAPKYAASIFFELWSDPADFNSQSIKIIYNDMPLNLCRRDACTLQEFKELVKYVTGGLTLDSYHDVCGKGSKLLEVERDKLKVDPIEALLLLVMCVLVIGLCFVIKRQVFDTLKTASSYDHRPQQGEIHQYDVPETAI